jgi:hypothetical protein
MTEVAYQAVERPQKNVEIVVHIDEELGQTQRGDLVDYLTSTDGISAAEFCPLRFHLMLVQYDRDRITSQDVLGRANSRQITAKLIGPI